MPEPVFEVVASGLLTTVQDAGRPGFGGLGVPISGACDGWSLAVANALLGNDATAAALECTLLGPELRALRDVTVAIAGADFEAVVRPAGRTVPPGSTVRLAPGDSVALAAAVDGVRAYVAVPDGVEVPVVLGSRSTCLVAGFGGFEGRPLRSGDVLYAGRATADAADGLRWPDQAPGAARATLRIVPGPDSDEAAIRALTAERWSVSPSSDRRGVRLMGASLPTPGSAGERVTIGVLPGTVQLPPDGLPIVLLADAQPTGGYPVIGVVISADLHVAGQLAPLADVTFELVSPESARAALVESRAELARGIARLRR